MKLVLKSLKYVVLIPFIACIPGFILNLCGYFWMSANIVVVPLLTGCIYVFRRKNLDMKFAMKVNGIVLSFLLTCFTLMMMIAKGNVESQLMTRFICLIFPFFPIMIIMGLMGRFMLLYACALLSYFTAFVVCAFHQQIKLKSIMIPIFVGCICVMVNAFLYMNRPNVKYGGHGFDYMNGYSSTDFTDYTVYANHSKLVQLDHEPALIIENEEEMPILDGAEACYPLYAAFAKAVYQDIDQIELHHLNSNDRYDNGKIVTFTNTIFGFNRLIREGNDSDKYGDRIDMFFGARPSDEQITMAKEFGIELEITPIGKEAFVFFVEEDNPISDLTSSNLKAIYHGDITNWKELGGKDQDILAFQRPNNSGSQTMMTFFMGNVTLKAPQTYERVNAMSGVIKEVAQYANEKGAIGYTFRYFLEELNQEKCVKMLSIDGVYPTLENIENGTYPLLTDVCVITRKNETNPNVEKMIEFILSSEGQEIIHKTGYGILANQDE